MKIEQSNCIPSKLKEINKVIDIVKKLRDPEKGCPWDLKQDSKSLLKFLIEESYEFIHAVESNNVDEIKDELGDVFLQVILQAQIAEESNLFTLEDVAKNLADKLIYRHPHVFKDSDLHKNLSPEEVKKNWEILKDKKKEEKSNEEELDPICKSYLAFPALHSSFKIGEKSNKLKFDWDSAQGVMDKVEEEWEELKNEIDTTKSTTPQIEKIEEELGDLLFTIAQLCRHLKLNPEEVLRKSNKKFLRRFEILNNLVKNKKHCSIEKISNQEKETFWEEAKKKYQKQKN